MISFGTARFAFSYLGERAASGSPTPGPSVGAAWLSLPGQDVINPPPTAQVAESMVRCIKPEPRVSPDFTINDPFARFVGSVVSSARLWQRQRARKRGSMVVAWHPWTY